MNKTLLNKTLRPQLIFAFLVFALSIPTYFLLVDWIWLKELDENNELMAQRIENEFNEQQISDGELAESIQFWNEIQPVSKIKPVSEPSQKDSVYTARKQNPYSEHTDIDQFRVLITNIEINGRNFTLTVETNMEESEETIAYIAAVTLVFFLILVSGFWLLNRQLSQRLWKPFRDTLSKLKAFNLNKQTPIQFQSSDTLEFEELNAALHKLLAHSISIYKTQKEFTENASHELQTPLAIIKNKLDNLLQKETITDRQYQIIEEINRALTRVSRINKNLLLLAKIENRQFEDVLDVYLSDVIENALKELDDFIINKNLGVQTNLSENIRLTTNLALMEILVSNLLINAVRYAEKGSIISITFANRELIIANKGDQALDKNVLFDRFKKVSAESKGSGLGLAIVKEICLNNGWQVDYRFEGGQHYFILKF